MGTHALQAWKEFLLSFEPIARRCFTRRNAVSLRARDALDQNYFGHKVILVLVRIGSKKNNKETQSDVYS